MVMDANEKVGSHSNEDIFTNPKTFSVSEGICSSEIYPNIDVGTCNLKQFQAPTESEPRTVSVGLGNVVPLGAVCSFDSLRDLNARISHCHSKKVIKHALRHQAKRRRTNTTIAYGSSSTLSRIVAQSQSPHRDGAGESVITSQVSPQPVPATMREVLASIPGFSIKPRKRSNKKLSAAAQLEQTKEGCIDLETPDSILVNTNLRTLLNKHTFSSLPPLYQYKLIQLLPYVDRAGATGQPDTPVKLSTSGLNNEFFARACLEWRERLAEGEFTPENRQKLKTEAEKEKSRLDPWKLKHFEPIWGERNAVSVDHNPLTLSNPTRPSLKTTIKLRPSGWLSSRCEPRKQRTVGAITRAVASYREEVSSQPDTSCQERLEDSRAAIHTFADQQEEVALADDKTQPDKTSDDDSACNIELVQPLGSFHETMTIVEGHITALCSDSPAVAEKRSHDKCELQQRKCKVLKDCGTADSTNENGMDTEDISNHKIEPYGIKCAAIVSDRTSENYLNETDQDPRSDLKNVNVNCAHSEDNVGNKLLETSVPVYDDNCTFVEDFVSSASLGKELNSSVMQDISVTRVTLSNTKNVTYNSDVVHDDNIIRESAILSTSCILVCGDMDNALNVTGYKPTSACTYKGKQGISVHIEGNGDESPEEMEAALFAAAAAEDSCWEVVEPHSNTLFSEVNVEAEHASVDGTEEETIDEVKVIPMQEELEVRLEEGSFPVAAEDALSLDWPYAVKVESVITAEEISNDKVNQTQYQEYSTGQAVKLELEVTLTPEVATSSVSPITGSTECDASSATAVSTSSTTSKTTMTTVIPPTTIVCLPSVVSTPNMMNHQTQLISCMSMPCSPVPTSSIASNAAVVASSSVVPYLSLTSTTPMRALPTQMPKLQVKVKSARDYSQVLPTNNRSSRGPSNKPPPGAVNLERSYQICQAVIQNSPNRDQLQCQLKPPPALLAANAIPAVGVKRSENRAPTQYGVVTSSRNGNKGFTPPLPATINNGMSPSLSVKSLQGKVTSSRGPCLQHRQSSPPVVLRHVFTSSQGVPVTMAVLPQTQVPSATEVTDCPTSQASHVGQYILVHRTGVGDQQVIMSHKSTPPRASSAPPSNHQAFQPTGGVMGRGRPASVDVEQEHLITNYNEQFMIHCPNPGTQAVSRRERDNGGIPPYGDVGLDAFQSYTMVGDSESMSTDDSGAQVYPVVGQQMSYGGGRRNPNDRLVHSIHIPRTDLSNCDCNLKAMIICQKCGAFCHDDCITPSHLCTMCYIR